MADALELLLKVLKDALLFEDDWSGCRVLTDECVDAIVERFTFYLDDCNHDLCNVLQHIWIKDEDDDARGIVLKLKEDETDGCNENGDDKA